MPHGPKVNVGVVPLSCGLGAWCSLVPCCRVAKAPGDPVEPARVFWTGLVGAFLFGCWTLRLHKPCGGAPQLYWPLPGDHSPALPAAGVCLSSLRFIWRGPKPHIHDTLLVPPVSGLLESPRASVCPRHTGVGGGERGGAFRAYASVDAGLAKVGCSVVPSCGVLLATARPPGLHPETQPASLSWRQFRRARIGPRGT